MTKTPMQLWIEALRSGKYKQARGWLKNQDNEFCCLGVACEVYSDTVEDIRSIDSRGEYCYKDTVTHTTHTGHLPSTIAVWLGIDSADWNRLISLNDSSAYTFDMIANVIEKEML